MTINPTRQDIKQRLQKYGILIAYSALGMAITGYFSFKIAKTRLETMRIHKPKSRIPILHANIRRIALLGLLGAAMYTYGLWEIIKKVPQSETNLEMRDEGFLAEWKRTDPELQDMYILRSMRMFRVSEELVDKAKEEFRAMGTQRKSDEKAPNLNSQLFWALLKRKKIEKQYEGKKDSHA